MKHPAKPFYPLSIFSQIAHFITANCMQPQNPKYTSLIFTSHHQTLKPIELCLKLRQAFSQLPNQGNQTYRGGTLQFVKPNQAINLETISQTNSVNLFYLPKSYFTPMKPISVSQTMEKDLCARLKQECSRLLQNNSASHCSVILWNPEISQKPEDQPFTRNLPESFCSMFPQIRFAQVLEQNITEHLTIFKQLLAVLRPNQLAYFLKGWLRPELKTKGLAYHPAFGLLANQDIEKLLEICQKLYSEKLSTKKPLVKPCRISNFIDQKQSQTQWILQPFKPVHVPNSNTPASLFESRVTNG